MIMHMYTYMFIRICLYTSHIIYMLFFSFIYKDRIVECPDSLHFSKMSKTVSPLVYSLLLIQFYTLLIV